MNEAAATTPAMAQYLAAKKQHPDALVFFRMGDFYELFFDDAKLASKALGITLTSRSKGDNPIPMAGVPVRALDGYLKRLVQKGHRVAICEQMQDPKEAKGVVERQVVRVVTPGTLTEDSLLDDRRPNHLVAACVHKDTVGLAWVELSTGAFRVHECPVERAGDELQRIEAAELLLPDDLRGAAPDWLQGLDLPLSWRPPYDFGTDTATRALTAFFKTSTLAGFGIDDLPRAVGAAGALIGYLQETQRTALPHLRAIEVHDDGKVMRLDRATRQSLELVRTLRQDGDGTPLLEIVDRTRTPMGARLLRSWLLAPLLDLQAIQARQDAVVELVETPDTAAALLQCLQQVLDLERLTSRAAFGRAHGRDLLGLRQSLDPLPEVKLTLLECRSETLRRIGRELDPLTDLAERIQETLADEPPLGIKDGGLIRAGHSAELDELRALAQDGTTWLARYQQELSERTGIPSLKVGFNKVFGYYIEVTHTHKHVELPPEFVRKQTTKNAERYVTDALRTYESKVLKAEENSKALEYELFTALREAVAAELPRLQRTAALVAELDVYLSLAQVARDRGYCRPEVDDSRVLRIEDGRHPVLEATHAAGTFVPNDTDLQPPRRRLSLLTGPNMAGKSTYIRQNALIVLLAQVGSFVPAKAARIGVVDRIFTRVGSSDDISRGASTFMVEMTETANILNNATARSLVILDEVGRGTSTYDGMSLAWAIAEDLHDRIGCRALFATHYHQLIDLQAEGRGVIAQRVAVREWGEEIVFLHRIEDGGTDRSYGLHVARLAGIPRAVIGRAEAVLQELESEGQDLREHLVNARERQRPGKRQQELFAAPPDPIVEELRALDVDGISPRDALQLLAKWKERAGGAP
ncbi:MAG: DNA mismatch repair protein MutS [Planctomycetota bacterium]